MAKTANEVGTGKSPLRSTSFFFAPTETISDRGWTEHERNQIIETRWWTIEELRRTTETIYPVGIADLLDPLLSGNYPAEIIKLPPI
jgi:hypothetical protein